MVAVKGNVTGSQASLVRPILHKLYWRPESKCIVFKILFISYKVLNSLALVLV